MIKTLSPSILQLDEDRQSPIVWQVNLHLKIMTPVQIYNYSNTVCSHKGEYLHSYITVMRDRYNRGDNYSERVFADTCPLFESKIVAQEYLIKHLNSLNSAYFTLKAD